MFQVVIGCSFSCVFKCWFEWCFEFISKPIERAAIQPWLVRPKNRYKADDDYAKNADMSGVAQLNPVQSVVDKRYCTAQ